MTDGAGRVDGRFSTDGYGGAWFVEVSRLTVAVEPSVHRRVPAPEPGGFSGRSAREGGALVAGVTVRESVTQAGTAERARAVCITLVVTHCAQAASGRRISGLVPGVDQEQGGGVGGRSVR
jgi:hypothetical protein